MRHMEPPKAIGSGLENFSEPPETIYLGPGKP